MEIRMFPEFPLGIAFGGLEMRCLRTFSALKKIGVSIKLLDYYDTDDNFDILHIFGNPPSIYEICYHAAKSKKIIISAVCGMSNISDIKILAYKGVSQVASFINLRTDYDRLRIAFGLAAHIICLNEFEKIYVTRKFGVSEKLISIISNGVEEYFFNATDDLFKNKYGISEFVLYTGNIIQRKNPLLLAQALTEMNQKGVFIGRNLNSEVEYVKKFEKLISSSKNLIWIKGLSYNDPLLASAYKAASVFCLPSFSETQPQSALEAMACGIPIILGDFPYACQAPFDKALLCNPINSNAIKNSIRKILKNPNKYAKPLPPIYRWENIANRIFKIYRSVLSD